MRSRINARRLRIARLCARAGAAALLVLTVSTACSSDPAPPAAHEATSSVAAPAAQVAPLPRSRPIRVQIPAIGVDSPLMDLGLQADGTMQVPPGASPAGWYTGAPTPGERGPAVLAGHVDWAGHLGVFSRLHELEPGDEVTVARQDGSAAVFRVVEVKEYPKTQFPTGAVYGDLDHAGLRLITCGGPLDRQAHSYDDNIVAFADLVATRSAG